MAWGHEMNLQNSKGFTLIELLVVVSILSAIAFTTATGLQYIDREVDSQLTTVELAEVAKAVRQFRADTGYFPREGVFDVKATSTTGCSSSLFDSLSGGSSGNGHPAAKFDLSASSLPSYLTALPSCDEKLYWFYNAANLSQLTGVGIETHMETDVFPWQETSLRGWRGPYLDASAEGFVDMGYVDFDPSDLGFDWAVDGVAQSTGGIVEDIPAVFVGGENKSIGSYFLSRRVSQDNPSYTSGDVENLEYAGRPVLMFVEKTDVVADRVVLLSAGADGIYDGYTTDCQPLGDDEIVCIYAD